jgi:AraC-like DNA-binding protein
VAQPPPLTRQALAAFLQAELSDEQQAPDHPRLGAVPSLRATLLTQKQALLSEELYLCRQRYTLCYEPARSWLFFVLQGSLALDLDGREHPLLLAGSDRCLCLTRAQDQEFTVLRTPLRLLRFGLPLSLAWQPDAWSGAFALPLVQPMLRLLQQAHVSSAPLDTRERLFEALQSYCFSEIASLGIHAQDVSRDPLGLLIAWLPAHLARELSLADLAAAACLSARRLQELCQQRFNCSPMELLRQKRLEAMHAQLLDSAFDGVSTAELFRRWQLSDSTTTRQAFLARYGQTPQALRKHHRAASAL